MGRLQIFWKKAILHLLQSPDPKLLVQLQAHMAFDYSDVERGNGTPKFPAESGGNHPGTPVFLLFDVVQMGS